MRYDEYLQVEACRFEGIMQPFPVHFHSYYVIGFVESGGRYLTCGNAGCSVVAGDVVVFNPQDNHACTQADGGTLDYRAFNIKLEVMDRLAKEITCRQFAVRFHKNVIRDAGLFLSLCRLHEMVMSESTEFEKSELLLLAVEQLIQECGETKKRLEQKKGLADAVFSTGFSDQAHFTNFFRNYIGLTPKQYKDIFKSTT